MTESHRQGLGAGRLLDLSPGCSRRASAVRARRARSQPVPLAPEQAHRRLRRSAPLGRAAGVEDLKTALLFVQWHMAVAENDGIDPWKATAQASQATVARPGIVDYCQATTLEAEFVSLRQCVDDRRLVDVAVYRVQARAEGSYLLQRRGPEEIAGVNRHLGFGEQLDAAGRQAPAAARHVGVGDDRDHGRTQLSPTLALVPTPGRGRSARAGGAGLSCVQARRGCPVVGPGWPLRAGFCGRAGARRGRSGCLPITLAN